MALDAPSDPALSCGRQSATCASRTNCIEPRIYDNLDLVTVSTSYLDRAFVERSDLNSSGRTEDMPLGFWAGVTLGRNFLAQGVPAPLLRGGRDAAACLCFSRIDSTWDGMRHSRATGAALGKNKRRSLFCSSTI